MNEKEQAILAATVPVLIGEVKDFKAEVQAERSAAEKKDQSHRKILRWLVVITIIAAVSAGLGALASWALVEGRSTTRGLLHTIQGCLTPEGECAQQTADRQADTIDRTEIGVVEGMIDLEACRFQPTEKQFRACAEIVRAEMQKEADAAAAERAANRAADQESAEPGTED